MSPSTWYSAEVRSPRSSAIRSPTIRPVTRRYPRATFASAKSPTAYTSCARPRPSTCSTTRMCGSTPSQAPWAQTPANREILAGTSAAGVSIFRSEGSGMVGACARAAEHWTWPSTATTTAHTADARGRIMARTSWRSGGRMSRPARDRRQARRRCPRGQVEPLVGLRVTLACVCYIALRSRCDWPASCLEPGQWGATMKRMAALVVAAASLVVLGASAVQAFTCPVVIKQAEDLIRKAESKPNQETRPLVEEAKKYLEEAKAHHSNAKAKRDHAEAVRKAKFAIAFAEEAAVSQAQ